MENSKNNIQLPQTAVSGSVTASELRLGNLVSLPSGVMYRVDIIYKNYEMLKHWRPIRITELLLIKLGFNNNIFEHIFEIEEFYLTKEEDCFFKNSSEIKYVHQLQNLYFALTGSELQLVE